MANICQKKWVEKDSEKKDAISEIAEMTRKLLSKSVCYA